MEALKPYVWLKKNGNQYKAFFAVSIPNDYQPNGLAGRTDDTATGIRTYKYVIDRSVGSGGQTIQAGTDYHAQPSNISKLKILVVINDGGTETNEGETTTNYQDADDMA